MNQDCFSAICELKKDKSYGIVKMHQCKDKRETFITMSFTGMPKNKTMAIHIHEYGNMTRGCNSLGAHWNPKETDHGSRDFPEYPRHSGDLINNITTDKDGNYNLGITDQLVFPEIDYDTVDQRRGFNITIVTTAKNESEGFFLLKELGVPFAKIENK